MLPDRRAIESFKWLNKEKLFRILKKYEAENVVLVSGDVHYAQLYKDSCPSLTGQNNLWEFTSSGLSHTQDDFLPFAKKNMQYHTANFYSQTDPMVLLNYGQFEIHNPQKSN